MICKFSASEIVLIPQVNDERDAIADWLGEHGDHVFAVLLKQWNGLIFTSLGRRSEWQGAEPLNIVYDKTPAPFNLISNLAPTPFVMDGAHYASVEGFWQGLKFPDDNDRTRIGELDRHSARKSGEKAKKVESIVYGGRDIRVGTYDHWQLMERACRAKFLQHEPARRALIDTGTRLLTHKVARDSRTIPGVIMADIWMRLRDDIAQDRF
jgi:predicted NAD-dependent protein-ADP-ribosyltransferase YbiA (DUF1768 family)